MICTCPQEYERQGKWVNNPPDNGCCATASDAEDGLLDLRTTPVLVFGLDGLGVVLRSVRFFPAPFPFGPRVFQGRLTASRRAKICSLRTIKSDAVVGPGGTGDEIAKRLDTEEPGGRSAENT